MRRALSTLIWLAAVALTALAVTATPRTAAGELPYAPFLVYQVPPGEAIDLLVPGDARRIRLLTRSAAPDAALRLPYPAVEYAFDVAWLRDDGSPVLERTIHEQSLVSQLPGPRGPWRSAWLPDGEHPLTDDRLTLLPAAEVLPGGGLLRVRAGTAPLFVRAYAEDLQSWVEAERTVLGPTTELQERLVDRAGLADPSLLEEGEKRALSRAVWRTLRPDTRSSGWRARWIDESELRISPSDQPTTGMALGPARRVALNLVGPATVRLSGPVDRLEVVVVGPPPEAVRVEEAAPLGLGEGGAVRYVLPEGPASLHLVNPTGETVGPILASMDGARPEQLFGWTAAAPLERLVPFGVTPAAETVLIGPEFNHVRATRTGAGETPLVFDGHWPGRGEALQLLVRPLLAGPDDAAPRTVDVAAYDAEGTLVWGDVAAVPVVPTPYDHVLGDGSGWLGEPVELFVPVDTRARRFVVRSPDSLAVIVRTRGAPQGDPTLYPLLDETLEVRYPRRPETVWRWLEPVNGEELADQQVRIAANVRIEPRGRGEDEEVRHYASVAPDRGREERVWLVPADPEDPPGLRYCRYEGEGPFPRSASAVSRQDGVLSGVLWASELGRPYRIALDGETWQQGRTTQRVHRFETAREPARSRVALEAPAGSTLWLRTWAASCPGAARPTWLAALDRGEAISFTVDRAMEHGIFVVAGVADGPVHLGVRVDGGTDTPARGLHPVWTRDQQILELLPTQATATLLDDPARRLPVLDSAGFVLGTNLPARHRVTLENLSGRRVHLRGAIQVPEPVDAYVGIDEASWVRVRP